ncbi:mitotic apparatus protein p62-like [Papaver somniferum]|uniref:mitotic apparatus protein p62-like n=1 Tax=Papaver somniferum TaxID=3469 RepID=UPI000E6F6F02|nr:mitotic apparatus protein p62-like [Papaver somniferum]
MTLCFWLQILVISSSDHSSSSSEEDSKTPRPEMKISAAEARAKMDLSDAKEMINGMPLDRLKAFRDAFLKRESEDEKLATYQQKRRRLQQTRLSAEDETWSRANGVASDSNEKEVEFVWEPVEREVKPYPPSMRVERLARADFRSECEEDEYFDVMYGDPEDQLEEVPSEGSDDDSKEELEENSMKDNDRESDDESDDSDD